MERLESYDLKCWIAPRDIPGGAQWAEEISLAVTACDTIFPFQQANYVQSY
ncbi:MAG: hypothetical protein J5589_11520 [Firmicutes bacterium]|nr:hypothetical protein [Bacillota bacterium]